MIIMEDKLCFDPEAYEVKTCEQDGTRITYLAYENLDYCANPADPIQKMNIYVPQTLAQGGTVNGYTIKTAPIFMPNTVGGYMPGPAEAPGRDFKGRTNTVYEGLRHGYVVVSVGVRGRTTGTLSDEFFIGGNTDKETAQTGKMTGRAPALIVDMKAAIRYLRHNKEVIPGNAERIITNGTSAGGALSAMTGASGNSRDYESYLQSIGAADERDDIFAASCYCPIHNLEHADMAYEWLFQGQNDFHMMAFKEVGGKVRPVPVNGRMTKQEEALSMELKNLFPAYVNSLHLKDAQGNLLTLDQEGHGSFEELVKQYIMTSAQRKLDHPDEEIRQKPAPGSDIHQQESLTIIDGKVTALDLPAYVKTITRMKKTPAFDALDLHSPENEEFGTETVFARHFTAFSREHSTVNGDMAEDSVIKMLNPVRYIGEADTAKYWRIRHGSFDRDTSLAIPVILAVMLENAGCQVDFHLPWGLPHSGDYDLPQLFAWIDEICR